jgi:hypothetical protein
VSDLHNQIKCIFNSLGLSEITRLNNFHVNTNKRIARCTNIYNIWILNQNLCVCVGAKQNNDTTPTLLMDAVKGDKRITNNKPEKDCNIQNSKKNVDFCMKKFSSNWISSYKSKKIVLEYLYSDFDIWLITTF